MKQTLSNEELEQAYELIAQAIDGIDAEKETLFLSKLSLTLANICADVEKIKEAIEIAKTDL